MYNFLYFNNAAFDEIDTNLLENAFYNVSDSESSLSEFSTTSSTSHSDHQSIPTGTDDEEDHTVIDTTSKSSGRLQIITEGESELNNTGIEMEQDQDL